MVYISGDNNLEDYVVKDIERELGGAGSHGITIYRPGAKNQKIDFAYYRTLDLSAHTRWDDFVNAFIP